MTKFLCIDQDDCCTVGNSIESAFETYKADIDSYADIEDVLFYELKTPIKASFKLVIDGGS